MRLGSKIQLSTQKAAERPPALHGMRGSKPSAIIAPQASREQAQLPNSARLWQGDPACALLPPARDRTLGTFCQQRASPLLCSPQPHWNRGVMGFPLCHPALPISSDSPGQAHRLWPHSDPPSTLPNDPSSSATLCKCYCK